MEKFGIIFLSLFFCKLLAAGYGVTIAVTPVDCTTGGGYFPGANITVTSSYPVSLTGGSAPYYLYSGQNYTVQFTFNTTSYQNATAVYPYGYFNLTGYAGITYMSPLIKLFSPLLFPNQVTFSVVAETSQTPLLPNTMTTVTILFALPAGLNATIEGQIPSKLMALNLLGLTFPFIGAYSVNTPTAFASFKDQAGNLVWCKQGFTTIVDTPPTTTTTTTPMP